MSVEKPAQNRERRGGGYLGVFGGSKLKVVVQAQTARGPPNTQTHTAQTSEHARTHARARPRTRPNARTPTRSAPESDRNSPPANRIGRSRLLYSIPIIGPTQNKGMVNSTPAR